MHCGDMVEQIKQLDKLESDGGNKMITVFTRKELLVTFDMKRQSDIRDILSANGLNTQLR